MKKLLIILLMLSAGSVSAQTLEDLNFMAGNWTGTQNGAKMQEIWTTSPGGIMVGLHKDVFPNGKSSFEFLRIVSNSQGITYLASPGGSEPTPFTLKEVKNKKATFENLDHDFPQRIIYERQDDKLMVRIEDASGEKGMGWVWTKTKLDSK